MVLDMRSGFTTIHSECRTVTHAHFSNQIIYKQLIETIRQRHPEVHYENLNPVFPLCVCFFSVSLFTPDGFLRWADINWDNPSESLYIKKDSEVATNN